MFGAVSARGSGLPASPFLLPGSAEVPGRGACSARLGARTVQRGSFAQGATHRIGPIRLCCRYVGVVFESSDIHVCTQSFA